MKVDATVSAGMLDDEPTVVVRYRGASVEIALLGATVLHWVVNRGDGPHDLVDGYRTAAELRSQSGIRSGVMAPFCDRITDARYTFGGVEHDLLPGQKCRLIFHGLVRSMPFTLGEVTHGDDAVEVTLVCRGLSAEPQPGYPFPVDVEVTYRLSSGSLEIAITGHNRGTRPAPYVSGWHPYFRLPSATTIAGLDLRLSSDMRVETDSTLIPLPGEAAYARVQPASAQWEPLADAVLDVGYVAGGPGAEPTVLSDPATGWRLTMSQDSGLVHLFTGDTIDRDRRAAIAIEPVESLTDAFNRPDCATAISLAPGARRTFRASVTVSVRSGHPNSE